MSVGEEWKNFTMDNRRKADVKSGQPGIQECLEAKERMVLESESTLDSKDLKKIRSEVTQQIIKDDKIKKKKKLQEKMDIHERVRALRDDSNVHLLTLELS